MGFMADGQRLIRQYQQQGRRYVVIDDSPFWATFTGPRASLRTITRLPVAFLTPAEYRAWAAQRDRDMGEEA